MTTINNFHQASLKPPRFRTARTIIALMLREMSATYGRSVGGYIWAVVQPVGTIIILALAFSLLVRKPSLGTSFILFYATGYLPFIFYSTIAAKSAAALKYSRALLTYPVVTWVDAVLARLFLNTITSAAVFCIAITIILIVVEDRTILTLSFILNGVGICILIGFGAGLCNAVLIGFWQVWGQIWSIISRPLFLASGVLFLYDDMPSLVQDILWWNPLIHATGVVRMGFYPNYNPEYISYIYCYGVALTLIAFGLLFMGSTYKTVLER